MYSDRTEIDAAYRLVAERYERDRAPDRAMAVAAALALLGEQRSRASVARALHDTGDAAGAREHARTALDLLDRAPVSDEPFDTAISGYGLDRRYVAQELGELGLLGASR